MTEVADTLTHLCDAKAHSLRYSVREVNAIPVLCVCVCTHTSHHYRESVIILVTQHPCIWGCCGCIWWEARSRMSLYRSWTRELLPFLLKLPLGLKHIAQARPIRDLTQEWWWGEAGTTGSHPSEAAEASTPQGQGPVLKVSVWRPGYGLGFLLSCPPSSVLLYELGLQSEWVHKPRPSISTLRVSMPTKYFMRMPEGGERLNSQRAPPAPTPWLLNSTHGQKWEYS